MLSPRFVGPSIIPLLALLAACGTEGAADSPSFTVRDSAGIQIIENTAPMWGEGDAWTLTAQPTLDIGVVDGAPEYQFSDVATALRLPSRRIVVANGGSQEVRYYDAVGDYIRTVGGEGGGPGEFQGLRWIRGLRGDSLLAYDGAGRRLTTFDSTGALVATKTLTLDDKTGYPQLVGQFADGTLLVRAGQAYGPGEVKSGVTRDSVHFFRVSTDGSRINAVLGLRGSEGFIRSDEHSLIAMGLIFGRSSEYSLASDRIFAADNDVYEIGVYGLDGKLERLMRRPWEPRSVTEADIARIKERGGSGFDNPDLQRQIEEMIAKMPIPSTMPAFSTLSADDVGNLWVKEYPGADTDAPSSWTVFDPDGHMLGDVTMPARFTPKQIGADFVLGVWKDDVDVEHVRMYGLEKP